MLIPEAGDLDGVELDQAGIAYYEQLMRSCG